MKIKKGDTVEIISGKLEEKGKRGEVIKVLPADGRVVVSGINLHTKHQRQVQTQGGRSAPAGIVKFEAPVHISNVMVVCPKCSKVTRVGIERIDEKAVRICKKCKAQIDG
ncbi:MAG: 50S ribosomal protein L24 [Anaerolineaceae bacterium]|nr:50S ribosomal protein L24 [Anaerolineaceae bacterium]MBN2676541.1 50S ribosomal protein L24 [Anaerolineaceae bacterium]